MHKHLLLVAFFFIVQDCFAQNLHESVFPDLDDNELFEALQDNYTTSSVLSFSDARDTLFSVVWGKNDTLACVYTDFKRYMHPDEDPTVTVFNNGSADGINTEHSYPQSKGADSGNPRADMHHLFPSRVDINGVRASLPFEEIPDNETTSWYYDDIKTSVKPASADIDKYTEFRPGGLEVREPFMGNIARAIFYFYTIYREQAVDADPDFFDIQREDLCNWHSEDPVDQEEWDNTFQIASYQEDIPNPFVLDCRLARLYCPEADLACNTVGTKDLSSQPILVYPNPTSDYLYFDRPQGSSRIEVIGMNGKTLIASSETSKIDVRLLESGIYMFRLLEDSTFRTALFIKK